MDLDARHFGFFLVEEDVDSYELRFPGLEMGKKLRGELRIVFEPALFDPGGRDGDKRSGHRLLLTRGVEPTGRMGELCSLGPPNGIELSRLASPRILSNAGQRPGWPGRLQRVVRHHQKSTRKPVGDGVDPRSERRRRHVDLSALIQYQVLGGG